MTLSAKLRRAPTRLITGAFLLNTGLEKLTSSDDDTAKGLHGTASGAYPVFEKIEPKVFLRMLGAGEVALGAALLWPAVPAAVAGLGLTAFSGGLMGLYWRTPGMHHDGSPRPTQRGTVVAKDSWMFGIGTSLVIDALTSRAHDKRVETTHRLHDKRMETAHHLHNKRVETTHHLKEAGTAAAAKAGAGAHAAKTVAAVRAEAVAAKAEAAARVAKAVAAERAAEASIAAKRTLQRVGR
jgi:hypothetical protein